VEDERTSFRNEYATGGSLWGGRKGRGQKKHNFQRATVRGVVSTLDEKGARYSWCPLHYLRGHRKKGKGKKGYEGDGKIFQGRDPINVLWDGH